MSKNKNLSPHELANIYDTQENQQIQLHDQQLDTENNTEDKQAFQKINRKDLTSNTKCKLDIQLQQLESKLSHQIILKIQMCDEKEFQRQILRKLSQDLHQSLKDNLLEINQIQEKLSNPLLDHHQKQQIRQGLLDIRMHSLANTRTLVNIYRHHQYRLVFALFNIARTYQQLKCHQQAVTHLEDAIQINTKYKQTSKDADYFHSFLLSFLADSQFQLSDINNSLLNINEALQIQQKLSQQNYDVHDFYSLNLITRVLTQLADNQKALSFGEMAMSSAQKNYGKQSYEYAQSWKALGQVQYNLKDYTSALQNIAQAIRILQVFTPHKQQSIIQFYNKLSEVTLKQLTSSQVVGNQCHFDPYIQVLKRKYVVMENTFGYRDKRVIKEKRHLASSFLKYCKVVQAEEELQDILEIQEVVYGEKSVQVAKTLKLLGTVAMSQNQTKKAEKYLKKSQSVFHDQGYANLEKQVQAKLLILTGNGRFLVNNKI